MKAIEVLEVLKMNTFVATFDNTDAKIFSGIVELILKHASEEDLNLEVLRIWTVDGEFYMNLKRGARVKWGDEL